MLWRTKFKSMYESGGPWSTLGCVVDSWRVNVSLLCIYWLLEDWCVPQLAEAIPENEASTTIRKITAISGSTWGGLFYNLNWQMLVTCNWNTSTSPNNVRLRLNDCLYLLLLPDKRMCVCLWIKMIKVSFSSECWKISPKYLVLPIHFDFFNDNVFTEICT